MHKKEIGEEKGYSKPYTSGEQIENENVLQHKNLKLAFFVTYIGGDWNSSLPEVTATAVTQTCETLKSKTKKKSQGFRQLQN